MKKNNQGLSILDKLDKKGDGSLAVFTRKIIEFDRKFCDAMVSGNEFTIRLEIRGDKSKVVHCRVYNDEIERPVREAKS